MNKLQQAISALLFTEPFYGHLISKMRINKSKDVPSAGVYITDKINLVYNEDWLFAQDVVDIAKVLKHECGHILQEHIPRAKQIGAVSKEMHKRFNLATDATINVADLVKMTEKIGGVTVKSLNEMMQGMVDKANAKDNGKRLFTPMQDGQIAEYYYNRINQFADENPDVCGKGEAGDFGETTDDHSTWEKSEGNEEMMKEVAKDAVNNAVKSAGGIGNVPGDVAALVNEMNKSQVNWKQQLRQFYVNTLKSSRMATRKRRNRRYGILQPGVKKKPELHLGLCVDTSGSVSDKELAMFWGEMQAIHACGVKITVIEADAQVQNVYEFDPKKSPEFKGRGGTYYQAPIKKALELKVDGIAFFGDGDCADTPQNPNKPFVWCLVRNSPPPADFGKVIRLEEV
jgi:predicted metal-dependent peptidase